MFVELELLLREKRIGESGEVERESDGIRNHSNEWEWPWDRRVGPSWAFQVDLLYPPPPGLTRGSMNPTRHLESFHDSTNCSHLKLKIGFIEFNKHMFLVSK